MRSQRKMATKVNPGFFSPIEVVQKSEVIQKNAFAINIFIVCL